MTMPVSEICRAPWAFCSTTRTVRPPSRSRAMVSKIWSWLPGDRPSDGSSSSSSCGLASSTIAVSRICCSPPLRLPAMTPSFAESSGNCASTRSIACSAALPRKVKAPSSRFSRTVISGKLQRPCGTKPMPSFSRSLGGSRSIAWPRKCDAAAEMAVEAVDRAQQRRLAGAVRPDDRGDAAGRDGDREIDHHRLVGVADRELVEGEDRLSHGPRRSAPALPR